MPHLPWEISTYVATSKQQIWQHLCKLLTTFLQKACQTQTFGLDRHCQAAGFTPAPFPSTAPLASGAPGMTPVCHDLTPNCRDSVRSLLVPGREAHLTAHEIYLPDIPTQSAAFLPSSFKHLAISFPEIDRNCLKMKLLYSHDKTCLRIGFHFAVAQISAGNLTIPCGKPRNKL